MSSSRPLWYVGEEGVSGGWVGIYADDHKVIGRAEADDFDDVETLEHARVMAAAPDLLDALKAVLDVREAVNALANWGDQELIDARAAIAKAEGK